MTWEEPKQVWSCESSIPSPHLIPNPFTLNPQPRNASQAYAQMVLLNWRPTPETLHPTPPTGPGRSRRRRGAASHRGGDTPLHFCSNRLQFQALADFNGQTASKLDPGKDVRAPTYRGTSVIRNSAPLGPYGRTMPRSGGHRRLAAPHLLRLLPGPRASIL